MNQTAIVLREHAAMLRAIADEQEMVADALDASESMKRQVVSSKRILVQPIDDREVTVRYNMRNASREGIMKTARGDLERGQVVGFIYEDGHMTVARKVEDLVNV